MYASYPKVRMRALGPWMVVASGAIELRHFCRPRLLRFSNKTLDENYTTIQRVAVNKFWVSWKLMRTWTSQDTLSRPASVEEIWFTQPCWSLRHEAARRRLFRCKQAVAVGCSIFGASLQAPAPPMSAATRVENSANPSITNQSGHEIHSLIFLWTTAMPWSISLSSLLTLYLDRSIMSICIKPSIYVGVSDHCQLHQSLWTYP